MGGIGCRVVVFTKLGLKYLGLGLRFRDGKVLDASEFKGEEEEEREGDGLGEWIEDDTDGEEGELGSGVEEVE